MQFVRCLREVEVVKRLYSPLFHDLRTLYFGAKIVYGVGNANDVTRASAYYFELNVLFSSYHLGKIYRTLDIHELIDDIVPYVRRRGNDEHHAKRETGCLVINLRMVAFDNAVVFQTIEAVTDSTGGNARLGGDFFRCGVPGIQLEHVKDTAVHII